MKVYLFFHGNPAHSGGTKVLFNIAELLKSIGMDSAMMAPNGLAINQITWFDHNVEVLNDFSVVTSDDIVIMPEETIWAFDELIGSKNCRYIIINQGAHWSLVNKLGHARTKQIYQNALGIFVNSEYTQQLITRMFGKLNQYRFSVPIEPWFTPSAEKSNTICYMPRRNSETAECIAQYVSGIHTDWQIIPIVGLSTREVGDVLSKAKIFLSFGGPEGLGMPPIEAALAGCKVIGYHGYGGQEYFVKPLFTAVPFMEILDFLDHIDVYTSILKDTNPLSLTGAEPQRQALHEFYSPEKFKSDIISGFTKMVLKIKKT